nr:selenium-binding protein SBP56-related protein [Bosea sp. WAO]
MLSSDFSKPDALAVVDVKPSSPNYAHVVHTVVMPNERDELQSWPGLSEQFRGCR